jgi:hypothetical protein
MCRASDLIEVLVPALNQIEIEEGSHVSAYKYSIESEEVCRAVERRRGENKQLEVSHTSREHWVSFVKFMNRRWFTRGWIILEFSLGSKLSFACGAEIWGS